MSFLPALTLLTLLAGSPAARAENGEDPDAYRMNDLGGTVHLPRGYVSDLWADWELKAKSPRAILMRLWLGPYQLSVSEDTLSAYAEVYRNQLEKEGVSEVSVASKQITDIGGRKTGLVELRLLENGGAGTAWVAFFEGHGHTVHLRTIAARAQASHARLDLVRILEEMELDQGPAPVSSTVETPAGFSASLPTGWRAPLDKELEAVRKITAKVGEKSLPAESCWSAIRPVPGVDPDVMFACELALNPGPLDEHSFEGVESEVHQRFFGRADKPVDPAIPVTVGDRMGLYYQPPVAGHPVRLALAPFEGSMMSLWALSSTLDEAGLDAAVKQTLESTAFTGPDGGAPIIRFDERMAYYLRYRPTSPLVLGPGLLVVGLVAGGVVMHRRKRKFHIDDM